MESRKPADWVAMDDEHTNTPHLYSWGMNWWISKVGDVWWLQVTSGVEYGPFASLEAAKQHAEDVRGD